MRLKPDLSSSTDRDFWRRYNGKVHQVHKECGSGTRRKDGPNVFLEMLCRHCRFDWVIAEPVTRGARLIWLQKGM
jgi:hypothetical protein